MWSVVQMGKFLGADVAESERKFTDEAQAREYASIVIKQPGVYGVMLEYYSE